MADFSIYQSIGRNLQPMVVAEARSFPGKVTNKEFLEVAQYLSEMVQKDEYHLALGRPDFTIYIIDFKIWEHFFAMNTAID
ncbi:33daa58d-ac6c-4213-a6ff-aa54c31a0cdb [Sclerotinia trifoliorum]|uniref:33daa58d-ac6c-4213-a6ff-aa54c31a0cdb n=1 Tax=Sclerotinia trifoliorum TaxID=28548 RepID=A0A8H2VQT2_9HELO|nr:33daa58d-ac6c-4213-a6ff-aa54c31a0cdb [Sclerotinia trifoliorum]